MQIENIRYSIFQTTYIMDIVSRMKQYMERCQLTSSQFADRAGIPRPTLSQLLHGRNKSNEGAKKISSEIIKKLHDAFPDLNVMWLLFGDGDMVTDENIAISRAQNELKSSGNTSQNADLEDIQRQILFDDEFQDFDTEKSATAVPDKKINPVMPSESPKEFSKTISVTMNDQRAPSGAAFQADKTKKVQSIMVFYSDNSFEIFKPAEG